MSDDKPKPTTPTPPAPVTPPTPTPPTPVPTPPTPPTAPTPDTAPQPTFIPTPTPPTPFPKTAFELEHYSIYGNAHGGARWLMSPCPQCPPDPGESIYPTTPLSKPTPLELEALEKLRQANPDGAKPAASDIGKKAPNPDGSKAPATEKGGRES